MNEKNINSLGVIKFIDIIDSVLGKQYDTIVNTNPNSLKTLQNKTQTKS